LARAQNQPGLFACHRGERFEALPGRVYTIGFVRSYAAYLGLNAEELLDRLKTEMAGPDASEPVIGLVPPLESNLARGGLLPPAERKPMLGALPRRSATCGKTVLWLRPRTSCRKRLSPD